MTPRPYNKLRYRKILVMIRDGEQPKIVALKLGEPVRVVYNVMRRYRVGPDGYLIYAGTA